MPTDVGLAVDKKDPVFRDWLQAVYDEVKDQVTAEELQDPEGRGPEADAATLVAPRLERDRDRR